MKEVFVKLMMQYKIKGMKNLDYRVNWKLVIMWCSKLIVCLIIIFATFFLESFNL